MKISDIPAIVKYYLDQHRLLAKGWDFHWDRAKRRAGSCRYSLKLITLSHHYVKQNVAERPYDVLDTILHEIAHALAGPRAGHGPEWVKACLLVGARPERCYDNSVVMPRGKYIANCPKCNKEFNRHKRIPSGYSAHCNQCGRGASLVFTCVEPVAVRTATVPDTTVLYDSPPSPERLR